MIFQYVTKSRFDLRKGYHALKWRFSYPTRNGIPTGSMLNRMNKLMKRAP